MSAKPFPPSAQKMREARRRGEVPRSRFFVGAWVCAAGAGTLFWQVEGGFVQLQGWMRQCLQGGDLAQAVDKTVALAGRLGAPVLFSAWAAALLAGGLGSGWHWTPEVLRPRFTRVNPWAGLGRLFSQPRWGELLRTLALAFGVTAWAWHLAHTQGPGLFSTLWLEEALFWPLFVSWAAQGVGPLFGLLVLLGVLDVCLARWRHAQGLRMSRTEVLEEQRQSEGNPQQRADRQARHRAMAQGATARGVSHATALVVNPTHVAVALRYDPADCEVPYLVEKGREEQALQLRREAQRLGIPVVKDIPLARSLFHYDVGEPLPEELYQALAAVLHAAARSQEQRP